MWHAAVRGFQEKLLDKNGWSFLHADEQEPHSPFDIEAAAHEVKPYKITPSPESLTPSTCDPFLLLFSCVVVWGNE